MKNRKTIRYLITGVLFLSLACASPLIAADSTVATAAKAPVSKHSNLAAIGKKLANPLGNVWALFTEFDLSTKKGDISDNHSKSSYSMLFQPVLPIPLTEDWKLLTRPTVPIIFSTPVPEPDSEGGVSYAHKGALGDISIPLLLSKNPPEGDKWMFGYGPTLLFPTANNDLGTDTWEAGPALAVVYKPKAFTTGFLAQYWWSYAKNHSDTEDTSHGQFLYFFFYDLPNAWQIGCNPVIDYNDKADSGDKWNVPIGVTVAKMIKIGKIPVKIQLGVEYSVVSEDKFGKQWLFKLNLIPVIPGLIQKPLF